MKHYPEIHIGKRRIGKGHPAFIIAEISGNHNQSYERAVQIIDAAIDAGADAIKLQTYTPDTITFRSDKPWFKIPGKGQWAGRTLWDLYNEAYTPWEWQPRLQKYAEKRGVLFFSTPFDETAVDFLEKMRVPLYKIASFELTDAMLLEKIARTKKPVIMSRGMATEAELREAIRILRRNGTKELALLHCVSAYPAKPEDMNLSTIPYLSEKFGVVTGLSDHTLGTTVATGAVALGASVIEKHITLKRSDGGPDASFSMEPEEFGALVRAVREIEASIGKPARTATAGEQENRAFRRSLFSVRDIRRGEAFTKENVRSIRPGFGLQTNMLPAVLRSVATTDIEKGTPLSRKLMKRSGKHSRN